LCDTEATSGTALVLALAARKPTGKAQEEFRRLIRKIERCRTQIEAWRSYSIRYNERVLQEVEPLRAEFGRAQREMALLLDELLTRATPDRRLRKKDRAILQELLLTLLDDLMTDDGDEALHALRARHCGESPGPETERERGPLRSILEEVFGVDLDAEANADPEAFFREARRRMQEEDAGGPRGNRRARSQTRHPDEKDAQACDTATSRAGSLRADAAEAARQSLRDVFRKLVSALHPDREPDAEARERKTLLMQQVNQAYEVNDLLTLLTLQLEIEQIDAAHLAALPAERLAHYNRLLREQLKALEAQRQRHLEPYRLTMGPAGRRTFTPDDVDRHMSAHLAEQRAALRELRADLVAFRDPDQLRKRLARFEPEPVLEILEEFDALADFLQFASSDTPQPPRRRRPRSPGRDNRNR